MCLGDINIPFLKIITLLSYRYIYRYALCHSKCDMRIKLIKLKIYNRNFKRNSLFLISDSFYFYPVLCAFEPYGLYNMEITFVFSLAMWVSKGVCYFSPIMWNKEDHGLLHEEETFYRAGRTLLLLKLYKKS